MSTNSVSQDEVAGRKWPWLLITSGFVIAYYAGLVLSVVIRFGELPNYITLYDYAHNTAVIFRSTPSLRDMVPIMLDEWLLEIGYMNRDYGHGIAEWSIEILPPKFLIVLALGALVATNIMLLRRFPHSCGCAIRYSGLAATGIGAALVGFTTITMMWAVCCAAPSWAVGLALLGVGVSTAFALQPFGTGIALAGFAVLLASTYLLARRRPLTPRHNAATMPSLAQCNALAARSGRTL
jgi:hypothetical protein